MSEPNLIEAPKRRGPLVAVVVVVVLAVIAAIVFLATRGDDDAAAGATKVKLGVVGASDPYWEDFKKAAADADIDVDIQDFSDYTQPNPSVSEGELDINQFQHIIYLAEYNVANDDDLTPIGATAIYPLSLYSQKHDSVEDIKAGETVVVPDDDSNQARGLLVLQSAGLIELKDGGSPYSSLDDVLPSSKVKVKALQADLTPTSLPDVAAAIINNDYVTKAGLDVDDAIATDDASDPAAAPYINIFAVRNEDKDDPTLKKLVQIYHDTKAVTDGVKEVSGGTAVVVDTPVEDLRKTLADVEADVRAKG
ncbi:MetQ/NlpA family ABC transporter substrate-binding protein [Aeromicrobium massiliense]|uniref:MetQ/NlpA family ABC transporter substrate-binding protein n=1 Tax=Aeromicrobium massiliense TaxID=1464554 RepID=UPI0003186360|nr:MetQ/NlpA family ABC transporter substrate-binding protein [Aeromicrobium massiliense]